jgi:hypothetical protein
VKNTPPGQVETRQPYGDTRRGRPPVSPVVATLVALFVLLWPAQPAAHDIPNEVTVQAFIKPDGQRLRVLVRVPLVAMRDMDYPKPPGATTSDLLDLGRADQTLRDAATLWVSDFLDLYENDVRLPSPRVAAVRASLQSDRSFASYDEALAHVTGPPLASEGGYLWSQGLLDVMFEYSIQSDASQFSLRPRLARLGIRTITSLRFLPSGAVNGAVRAFEFQGEPGLVQLDPSVAQAVTQFVKLGFSHFLDSAEHLLFLFCLILPFRKRAAFVSVAISFAAAHSLTLVAAAYNLTPDVLWFGPLIDTLVAVSIVYVALENIVFAADGTQPLAARLQRRIVIAFAFGFAHGFGFSFALRRSIQFAGAHAFASLLSFNVGLEAGLLLVLVLLIPALDLVFRWMIAERMGAIIVSALVLHTAWHWMTDRWQVLRQYRFEWPAFDLAFWVVAMRWMMVAVLAAGLYWLVGLLRPVTASRSSTP